MNSPSLWKMNSLEKWTLSSAMCSGPHSASCYHDEKKNHLVSLHPFILLLLFIFFPLSSCAKLRLPKTMSPRLCKTSQRPLQRLLNSKPISDFGETLSRKDGGQREIFKYKSCKYKPQTLLSWCQFNIDFSLIEKSMRVLNMWLMIVQVYAIAHIAVNVGYQILILLI